MCQIKQETRVLNHMIINFDYVNFKLYTISTLANPKVLLILQTFQAWIVRLPILGGTISLSLPILQKKCKISFFWGHLPIVV